MWALIRQRTSYVSMHQRANYYTGNSPSAAQRALRERPERPQERLRLRQRDRQRSLLTWQAQRAWLRVWQLRPPPPSLLPQRPS